MKAAVAIGKIEVDIPKSSPDDKWTHLGYFLPQHDTILEKDKDTESIDCVVTDIQQV